jgi:hypothetical protein
MLKGKIKDTSDKKVLAEFRDGFKVEIRYTPRGRVQRIVEESMVTEMDPRTFTQKTRRDNDKFFTLMATEIVIGWSGLSAKVLRSMIEMEDYPDELPYSIEDAAELLAKAYDFDAWVQNIATHLECFDTARRAAETKNS